MEHTPTNLDRTMMKRFETPRDEECDALADMFLGAAPSAEGRGGNVSRPTVTPDLELVVAHHLEGGSARFAAHCRNLARRHACTVGLVRHAGAGWTAELLDSNDVSPGRRATVGKAIAHIAAHAEHVCVLLPAHDEIGSLVAGLAEHSEPAEAITVLSTSSEGDVVAAYRQIKSIALLGAGLASRVALVVMGADREKCAAAAERIVQTARRFLSLDLRSTVHVEEEPMYTEHPFDPHDPALVSPDAYAPVAEPVATPATHTDPAAYAPVTPREPQPAGPKPGERGLEALVGVGAALGIRCPNAPEVVIAVDGLGHLHVIAATFGGPGWAATAEPTLALTLARAFAARHRGVLAAVDARVKADGPAPAAHLVVDRFADAAPILESGLRLHLATIIEVNGSRCFGAAPLVG
jgi:hypothetical protein